jgi:hypothetical protein
MNVPRDVLDNQSTQGGRPVAHDRLIHWGGLLQRMTAFRTQSSII